MEPLNVNTDDFLLSKEIEIKEREANLLRIIMRCKKLGIDVATDIRDTEDELQETLAKENGTSPSAKITEEIFTSNANPESCTTESEDLVEPRIEDFGLSEKRLKAVTQIPITTYRIFKPLASVKPKPYKLENSESIDGSPLLSLRTVPFDKISGNEPNFDCTPEVCQMNKTSKANVHQRGEKYGSQTLTSPAITPNLNVMSLYEQQCSMAFDHTHTKRQSIVSPEEPELTSKMNQFKTFVINENNNAFLTNFSGPSISSSTTPEEPEFTTSAKHEDFRFSDLQMPQSPQLSLDWLKTDSNPVSHLF